MVGYLKEQIYNRIYIKERIQKSMTSFLLDQSPASETAVREANKLLNTIEGYIPKVIDFGVNIIIALVIFFVGKIIINWLIKICNKFLEKAKVEISIRRFLKSLLRAMLYIILIIIICDRVGINTASFIAVLGTLGLTVGLALQGSLSNFAGGVLILLLKPFKVGDYIVDSGSGAEGKVDRIDLFYTKIITGDNRAVFIPNGSLSNATITNNTEFNTRRVDIVFGIAYESDIDKAKDIIYNIAKEDEKALQDKEITVFVSSLDASQVSITLRVWCETDFYWDVRARVMEQVKKAFDANNIEIPFDQLQVHIAK